MAAAGAGGQIPTWRDIPVFKAFKYKKFIQTPKNIVDQIRSGDHELLLAYIDYLHSPEFAAKQDNPDNVAQNKQQLLNELLGDTLGRASFESFKFVVDTGADINEPLRIYGVVPLSALIISKTSNPKSIQNDNLKKFAYLLEKGANPNVHIGGAYDEYLITDVLRRHFYDELIILINNGVKMTHLSQRLLHPIITRGWYLAGILVGLLISNDFASEEILAQLSHIPTEQMQVAINHLIRLTKSGDLPEEIASNAHKEKFSNFRRVLVNTLGKDEATNKILALTSASSMKRRSHALNSIGGRRRRHTKRRIRR